MCGGNNDIKWFENCVDLRVSVGNRVSFGLIVGKDMKL